VIELSSYHVVSGLKRARRMAGRWAFDLTEGVNSTDTGKYLICTGVPSLWRGALIYRRKTADCPLFCKMSVENRLHL
jgi:hypothetical protein